MQVTALEAYEALGECVVGLGFFDGIHRGHQEILKRVVALARERGRLAAVFSFRNHPASVLRPSAAPALLTPFDEKIPLLEALGLDVLVWREFDLGFAGVEAQEFVGDVLRDRLRAAAVVVGPNYRFGKGAQGTPATMSGLEVAVVEPLYEDGALVSSTRVREAVVAGDLVEAARLLGRPYAARGEVVRGDARGRTIGFPTANLGCPPEKLLPADGVYAMRVKVGDETVQGVANLGIRPTFGERRRVLEVHLLDYLGDLYGRTLQASFIERLRAEMRFDGVDALIAQIARDVESARALLAR
ncbi:MAG: bifunctional riboflavin kinase/FAD synthetase [Armatimonadetes bacterium]|nr:bifunctional riboflavin kinase/FAD synthetase [Armatimonadota bacterium]